jgi:hypothetical protein
MATEYGPGDPYRTAALLWRQYQLMTPSASTQTHRLVCVCVSITRRERLVCLSYESMGEGATSAGATGEWLDERRVRVLCVCVLCAGSCARRHGDDENERTGNSDQGGGQRRGGCVLVVCAGMTLAVLCQPGLLFCTVENTRPTVLLGTLQNAHGRVRGGVVVGKGDRLR